MKLICIPNDPFLQTNMISHFKQTGIRLTIQLLSTESGQMISVALDLSPVSHFFNPFITDAPKRTRSWSTLPVFLNTEVFISMQS